MTDARFRFATDILRRLGEELNPSLDHGVLELVKNAHDVDLREMARDSLDWMARERLRVAERRRGRRREQVNRQVRRSRERLQAAIAGARGVAGEELVQAFKGYDRDRDREVRTLREEVQLYRTLGTAGIMSAVFAHEASRGPLKVIGRAVGALRRRVGKLADALPEDVAAPLDSIESSARSLGAFTDSTLDLVARDKRRTTRVRLHDAVVDVLRSYISNPPYFKIGRTDPRAVAASTVVHGQPNIYALFMAVSAALLRARGDFVCITPRSFASGSYFRRFRTTFFEMIRPLHVHVFESRRAAFSRDDVLQENVILAGVRRDPWRRADRQAKLKISCSRGVNDVAAAPLRTVPPSTALEQETVDRVLRLPVSAEEGRILALVDAWPTTLHSLGLEISTGPVVPFRATAVVDREGRVPDTHAPLLWMHHVRGTQVTWPLNRRKPEYICRHGAEALLIPNRNYVLMRRFTAKEEARRLAAAPYLAGDFGVPEVGLENHLNYIHRPGGTLSEDEAWGLTALYNSSLLDTYFRCVNGNTQVDATELRAMPLPASEVIVSLGRLVRRLQDPLDGLDELVTDLLGGARHADMEVFA